MEGNPMETERNPFEGWEISLQKKTAKEKIKNWLYLEETIH